MTIKPMQERFDNPTAEDLKFDSEGENMFGYNWRNYAACSGMDQDKFFPIPTGKKLNIINVAAKAVCARCCVKDQCGQEAAKNEERHGTWGRQTERERRAAARLRAYTEPKVPLDQVVEMPIEAEG